jgi:argininosuccinate synthase
MFLWTVDPEEAPDEPEVVEIAFEQGQPGRGQRRAAAPGGLVIGAERVRRETRRRPGGPGGEPAGGHEVARRLRDARRHDSLQGPPELESLCLDRDTLHFKEQVAVRYAELVYFGKWYHTSLREAMQAFMDTTQETVTAG